MNKIKKKSKVKPPLSHDAFDRLENLDLEEDLEVAGQNESTINGELIFKEDSNFEAELDYDGYDDIADYDNDSYESNVDGKDAPTLVLKFKDRFEDDSMVEESVIDPQENRSVKNQGG